MGTSSRQSRLASSVQGEAISTSDDISRFDFDLPDDLIAQYPASERTRSRLLVVGDSNRDNYTLEFSQLPSLLRPGDVLICNDSKVIPARLAAKKTTGGKVEILVERVDGEDQVRAQLKTRRPLRVGEKIVVSNEFTLTVTDRIRDLFVLRTENGVDVRSIIDAFGTVPLPPYINRPPDVGDDDRYQTVYARYDGSVAAPTAGLHFSENLIEGLIDGGVDVQYVTLHVGAGTFAPIRDGDIARHRMHSERCELSPAVCEAIERARIQRSRVVAVGTTTVRLLESAMRTGQLEPFSGETDLFIKPGFHFNVVDALITNFHLPRSTLLMLVCAFGGLNRVLEAYHMAIEHKMHFYSYGDAMFVEREV